MTPHTCPVCKGKMSINRVAFEGMTDDECFSMESMTEEEQQTWWSEQRIDCPPCKGTGIVWQEGPVEELTVAKLTVTEELVVQGSVAALESQVTDLATYLTEAEDTFTTSTLTFGYTLDYDAQEYVIDPPTGDFRVAMGMSDQPPAPVTAPTFRAGDGGPISIDGCYMEGTLFFAGEPDGISVTNNWMEFPEKPGLKIYGRNPNMHPERKAVLDYLDTLPEDMPLMVLTPQSHAELRAALKFHEMCGEYDQDSVWTEGSDLKLRRMENYQERRPDVPPEVSKRLAGYPITEGDEG